MTQRALVLSEEQGTGGILTTLAWLRQTLTGHNWTLDPVGVRTGRPPWLALVQQAEEADVLIASNNFQPAYWAVLLGLVTHRPVVIWVHGPLAEVLQHSQVSAFKKGFLQGVYNMAQALVFTSHSAMDSFDRAMPGVRQPLRRVIHNPAASPEADTPVTVPDTRTVQLGFVGRLSSEKRPELLLQTLACLPTYCHLNIVGDGPLRSALAQQLQAAPAELRLTERVHFAGEQAVNAQTYRHWQASVLCSAYEGYPMVALESLAAGVPCITTPLPPLREMFGTDAPQWIAPEDTPHSLARTILDSLQTPQGQRQTLAHSIAARHPAEVFGQQWHALLNEVLGVGPAPTTRGLAMPHALAEGASTPHTIRVQSVHFVHSGSAYLPELAAYRAELTRRGHEVHVHSHPSSVPDSADVVWWICGRVSRRHTRHLAHSQHVHEYASASVAPMAWLKDRIKAFTHPRPQHRVFQSEWVRKRMGIGMGMSDPVPYSLRDMGVPSQFLTVQAQGEPEFDLVYLGEMSRLLQFVPALQAIHAAGLRLLLIGQIPPELQAVTQGLPNIQTTGRIPQHEVPAQLLRARAGLNLVPNVLPLSAQTSTKMLEYLAVGLPVISSRSAWAEQIATAYPGRVRWLIALTSAQTWQQAVRQLPPPEADRQHLRHLTWEARLQSLPLWQALAL